MRSSAPRCWGSKGRKVLLLERNDRIGGCIRTEEITAKGFVHDVMATTFVLFITSPAYAALAPELEKRGPRLLRMRNCRRACSCPMDAMPCSARIGPPISRPSRRWPRVTARASRARWSASAAIWAWSSACSAASSGRWRPCASSRARPGGAACAASWASSARRWRAAALISRAPIARR